MTPACLDVIYHGTPAQRHTNALVLDYLLRGENCLEFIPKATDFTTSDARRLLTAVTTTMNPPSRVLLDTGAQVLELSN